MGLEKTRLWRRVCFPSNRICQKKVEGRNFEIRKHVLQYDDVMNVQRQIIYEQRRRVLEGENLRSYIMDMIESVIKREVQFFTQGDRANSDLAGLMKSLYSLCLDPGCAALADIENLDRPEIDERPSLKKLMPAMSAEKRRSAAWGWICANWSV